MTMAGKRPEIFLTQTNDVGRLLATIQKMPIHGFIDIARTIKIAQLSLKHRQNKNQKQRIVVFVGSPIEEFDDKEATKLGKQLRKNDVAIDCVNFGHPENIPILQALVDNCNKNGNSHLIDIQYGMNIADIIISSSIVSYDDNGGAMAVDGEGGVQPGGGAGGQFAEYGGIDPNLDPELAMAIRISLEEAKNESSNQNNASVPVPQAQTEKAGDVEMKSEVPPQPIPEMEEEDEEDYDRELEEAKRISMAGYDQNILEEVNEGANKEEDLGEVIDEEFIGEIMQDLGVPLTEDAVKE
mmetsp:Transcript_16693/g.19330  ORF Transcript_16693/g.19330 Transcript_16693/m.19330 type:complete len:297 (+) Transcript_16693:159-1049(+)